MHELALRTIYRCKPGGYPRGSLHVAKCFACVIALPRNRWTSTLVEGQAIQAMDFGSEYVYLYDASDEESIPDEEFERGIEQSVRYVGRCPLTQAFVDSILLRQYC